MIFSSNIFIYAFLLVVLVAYFGMRFLSAVLPQRLNTLMRAISNLVLLLASIGFYIWGSGRYVLILLTSIAANYIFGLLVHALREKRIVKETRLENIRADAANGRRNTSWKTKEKQKRKKRNERPWRSASNGSP